MEEKHLLELMESHGIKPTANRIVIARALAAAGRPMSMTELETVVETIDKSNVFRTLQTFREAHLVHVLDDSGDGVRYELCHSHHDEKGTGSGRPLPWTNSSSPWRALHMVSICWVN